ncbi:Fic family protein [Sporomusa carbonis]|uniref:Fic family protein n=1 Tax=Sporomusa carbonis TaxID=3076075 RepID=UPI003C7C7CB8
MDSPILYLSKYIIRNKTAYYRLLQEVRTKDGWEAWVLFILDGIEQTAEETLLLVKRINAVVDKTAEDMKEALPRVYSKELVELLFYEFYTKTTYIETGLSVSRKTAASYLASLEDAGFLTSQKIGKERIYLNKRLFEVVQEAGN